ncbi:MAG: DctP family TRAP transporter solute-binding subunit [Atribacterota bacterium]|nr:DctP family TRAP transporter solute-binding subunit [Atribacterota bacterium]MDD5636695.1 DctP family TRAP transporter solute-binding subunit [Atribacterota bacterium]
MIKKYTFSILLLIISIILIILPFESVYAEKITIQYAHNDPVSNIDFEYTDGNYGSAHIQAIVFKRIVENQTNGDIMVDIFPDKQLGTDAELLQSAERGLIQMVQVPSPNLPSLVPEYMAFTIPYLFTSPKVAYKVIEGPIGEKFEKLWLERTGLRILSWSHAGFVHWTNNTKPIHVPADFKGMKMRIMASSDKVKLVESLGGHVVVISWGELYMALQQGVADGQENPFNFIDVAKLYEVQKYLTVDAHEFRWYPLQINENFYQSLTPEYQKIIQDAAMASAMAYRGFLELGNTLWAKSFTEKGMEIYYPTQEELEEFIEVTRTPMVDFIKSQIGEEWVNEVLNAVKEVEKSLVEE